jgi:hypothetical protein
MIVFRFFISTTDDPHGRREQGFASPYGAKVLPPKQPIRESFNAAR